MFEPQQRDGSESIRQIPVPDAEVVQVYHRRSVRNYSVQSARIMKEWFRALLLCRVLLLCLVFIVYQTKLSKSTELFDLSELSASQQNHLWTQVDNWAVAVVFSKLLRAAYIARRANAQDCNPLYYSK
jgi:hypothetical protein